MPRPVFSRHTRTKLRPAAGTRTGDASSPRLAWEADNGGSSPDVEWYSEHIAPNLAVLSLTEIAGALGVSTSSASKFRRGLRVPALRHSSVLADVLGVDRSRHRAATRSRS